MIQTLRQAARSLALRPAFSLLIILIIALCIGGNASVFSVAKGILFQRLPYKDADRLVVLTWVHLPSGVDNDMSWVEAQDWRRRITLLKDMSPFLYWEDRLVTDKDSTERIGVNYVAPSYLRLLGIEPQLGRLFSPQEETGPGGAPVVILSDDLWHRRYDGDPKLVGQKIQLNGHPYTVIGIMPPGFYDFTESYSDLDAWLPASMAGETSPYKGADMFQNREAQQWVVLCHLKPGVTHEQAQREADTIDAQLRREFPNDKDFGARLVPVRQFLYRDLHPQMKLLMVGALLVLLIGCANVANLLLVRQAERQRDLSLRLALGASRLRLVQEVLAQSLVLAVVGGAAGVLLASWGTRLLAGIVTLPPFTKVTLDGGVLALAVVVTLLTGLLFGLPPAVSVLRMDSKGTLQQIKAASGGRGHSSQSRNGLLVFQVAVVVILLVLAGLLLRSFLTLHATGVDFATDRLLTARLAFKTAKYAQRPNVSRSERELLQRLEGVPGIEGAAIWGAGIPGIGAQYFDLWPAGASSKDPTVRATAHFISPGALKVLKVHVLKGREFTPQDLLDRPRVTVVTQALAKALWPGKEPIGQRLIRSEVDNDPPWTVVGVIPDTRFHGRLMEARRQVLFPEEQLTAAGATLLVRTGTDVASMTKILREAVRQVDPQVPLYDVAMLDQRLRKEESGRQLNAVIVSGYSVIALVLAVAGLYGMLAYSVLQRTREIGVRMALGARRQDVVGMVMKRALVLVVTGLLLGLVAAQLLARLMSTLLFGVTAKDPLTFLGVTLLFIVVAVFATYLPAKRASKIEPTVAMQYE